MDFVSTFELMDLKYPVWSEKTR